MKKYFNYIKPLSLSFLLMNSGCGLVNDKPVYEKPESYQSSKIISKSIEKTIDDFFKNSNSKQLNVNFKQDDYQLELNHKFLQVDSKPKSLDSEKYNISFYCSPKNDSFFKLNLLDGDNKIKETIKLQAYVFGDNISLSNSDDNNIYPYSNIFESELNNLNDFLKNVNIDDYSNLLENQKLLFSFFEPSKYNYFYFYLKNNTNPDSDLYKSFSQYTSFTFDQNLSFNYELEGRHKKTGDYFGFRFNANTNSSNSYDVLIDSYYNFDNFFRFEGVFNKELTPMNFDEFWIEIDSSKYNSLLWIDREGSVNEGFGVTFSFEEFKNDYMTLIEEPLQTFSDLTSFNPL
ncbi:hypothetical protein HOK68_04700 [Candidatus Woesearchaeota archaeon]|jgi:hypothetical protein|nr:hypothetical protein [Candidatus Woesearchaeota archaeon]MBT4387759.1 hypothetical protein [Candidatus Woesearchaeota archaeon]MBT4595578.1 hypothetical protein [Candidatus Woesearchaeota archaeon]MBT5740939.1 hypothetical protein [Candidatus Woesearchaeota archaeon]MBT6506047.1 hypothetical protein [Candidatus Woesearchaeota archaeon]